ncbi:hypothetical protein N7490_005048 [Penicillium lividum]|nr:hypothetical protein N7490_005048 [Penicillium lividum]
MFSKLSACLAAALYVSPIWASGICHIEFFKGANCAGTADATCYPDDTASGKCYWNTYVESIYFSCGTQISPAFVVCNGNPETCSGAKSFAVPITSSGCVEVGYYDGYVYDTVNNYPYGANDP